MRFKFLSGDMDWVTHGGMFVSKKLNNEEFDYWFVIRLYNWSEETGDDHKYTASLMAVSPDEAGQEAVLQAAAEWGLDEDYALTDMMKVQMLAERGTYAPMSNHHGNNYRKALAEARKEAQKAEMLFGFYMDRSVNRIGTSGWSAIKGDILAGLAR